MIPKKSITGKKKKTAKNIANSGVREISKIKTNLTRKIDAVWLAYTNT